MKKHVEILNIEQEKLHSWRYRSMDPANKQSLKLVYIPKEILGNPPPKTIKITLE